MSSATLKVFQRMTRALDRAAALFGENQAPTPGHLSTGQRGEDEAYFYLRRIGYVMVARNWRVAGRKGEIDLIGWEHDVLCFVEVKTRTTRDVKPAEAAVDNAKQKELRGMARAYLRRHQRTNSLRAQDPPPTRFDVVSVYYDKQSGALTDIALFRGAFAMA
jgi:putative endonuclease